MAISRISLKAFSPGLAAWACLLAAPAFAVTLDMVTVGNPGNANDTNGAGQVNYVYKIGKGDVTIGQYSAFLNAVAKTDTYGLYDLNMETDYNTSGIARLGSSGNYTYSVIGPFGTNPPGASSPDNRPMTYVSWFNAARFSNWMANGQPSGSQGRSTTEDGSYALNGVTSGQPAIGRNSSNPNTGTSPTFYLPSIDEWSKAAYYSPNYGGTNVPGYFKYATQSDSAPGNTIGSDPNQANWTKDVWAVTGAPWWIFDPSQNYLTDVGAFSGSESFYGTFDQNGNVTQWTNENGVFGGDYSTRQEDFLRIGSFVAPSTTGEWLGFRLAGPDSSAVPEIDPATGSSALSLVAGVLAMIEQRRRRAKLVA